jgi:hypothetical protein
MDCITRHAAAVEYFRQGLPITICVGKRPVPKGWPAKRWTEDEIDQRFQRDPELNVGCKLGAESFIDFDCDSPQAEAAMADLFDGDVPVTPTFRSPRGRHWLMAWHPDLAAIAKSVIHVGPLEIRLGANGKGCQSLLPPSLTDGIRRQWVDGLSLLDLRPAAIKPSILRRFSQFARKDAFQKVAAGLKVNKVNTEHHCLNSVV